MRLRWPKGDRADEQEDASEPTHTAARSGAIDLREDPPSDSPATELGRSLKGVEETVRRLGRSVGQIRDRTASRTSGANVLAGVVAELAVDSKTREAFKRAVNVFVEEVQAELNEGAEELFAELADVNRAIRAAIETAERDGIDSELSSAALGRLEVKLDGRFNDIDARLDEVEAVMEEPLPVDVSGILHALESKLFVPLDEMADSLAASQGGEAGKTLSSVAARLDKAVAAFESSSKSADEAGDPKYQRQMLERIDEVVRQIETLRRRITLRARPATREFDPQAIAAIAEALAARLSPPGPAAPRRAAPPPRPSAQREADGPDDAAEGGDSTLEPPGDPSRRKIRLR